MQTWYNTANTISIPSSDINECKNAPCGSNSNCKNTDGSYYCYCRIGYKKNGIKCTGKICKLSYKKTKRLAQIKRIC